MESVRSVRRNPYQQVRVLPIVRRRRHNPVPSGQSVRKLWEITALARRAKPNHWMGCWPSVASTRAPLPRPFRCRPAEMLLTGAQQEAPLSVTMRPDAARCWGL